MTWSARSSPVFPSNFGISEVILVGTGGQLGLYQIGSFINFDRSGKFKVGMVSAEEPRNYIPHRKDSPHSEKNSLDLLRHQVVVCCS